MLRRGPDKNDFLEHSRIYVDAGQGYSTERSNWNCILNICLFTPSFLPALGGMEVVIDKLARQFQCRGHLPVVIAQRSRHNNEIPKLPYEVIFYPRPRWRFFFCSTLSTF